MLFMKGNAENPQCGIIIKFFCLNFFILIFLKLFN